MINKRLNTAQTLATVIIISLLTACVAKQTFNNKHAAPTNALAAGFKKIPDSIQTSVYWYWLSDNISKQGVINDLKAMKAVGINRAFIGNIGLDNVPYGKVKLFSDEWWEITHTALKTASELGIEIGIFNSPGWSQSGGPWVKPEQAMRYLSSSETIVKGPSKISLKLNKPEGNFQDVIVLAIKIPSNYGQSLADLKPQLSSTSLKKLDHLFDKNLQNETLTPNNSSITVQTKDEFTARSLTIYPAKRNLTMDIKLEAFESGSFKEIKQIKVDRSNNNINVGFVPFAPVIVSFKSTTSQKFRLTFTNTSSDCALAEIEISSTPKVERYIEKTLAKMHPTPLPYWNEYQWKQQYQEDEKLMIAEQSVIDISSNLSANGILNWDIPEGTWLIMRTGMVPTGVQNSPASPEGIGLEVDKINHEHVIEHFNAFLGEIQRRIPAADRRTWKVAVQDSYEMGGQNWTDNFIAKFKKRYNYDPTPFIPTMFGHVIGSQDKSDRFLWDLRRFIADNVAYEYVGGLRKISNKNGLKIWLENYGHWGFPGEFLQYGGQSDEIGGEFWSEGELGNIENRAASSAAHIYGKTKVSAESFTAAGNSFGRYPALMKQRGDRFFTEGINNTLLHVYIQQAYEDKKPGMNTWFGNEFNRFNTWFYEMDMFVEYLKRCNFMLQQGKYVADVAYFIGEDAPKMTGIQDPELPSGHSFDYINAEVIINRLEFKDGKFMLPDGMSYRVLVLPKLETMRPELLTKIAALVKEGGVVLGPKPQRSPSFENYNTADQFVKNLANKMWGKIDGKTITSNLYGKGLIIDGLDLEQIFQKIGIIPDFSVSGTTKPLFIHRKTDKEDIYFISNQSENPISIKPIFNVSGKTPQLWNAIDASIRDLPEFSSTKNTTTVPLKLDKFESVFIVFNNTKATAKTGKLNFPEPSNITSLNTPWMVTFDKESSGPAEPIIFNKLIDWSKSDDKRIAYYSGKAIYNNSFVFEKPKNKERIFLNLGSVIALAKVKINGKNLGGVWTAPYKVDITDAVINGKNEVEIKVVNTWVNRLIGDSKLPKEQRKLWTIYNPYETGGELHPSGLLGPVSVEKINY